MVAVGTRVTPRAPHRSRACAANASGLPEPALALWCALGTVRCRSEVLPRRRGAIPRPHSRDCGERGYPETVVELAGEGLTKGAEILAPFVVLRWREARRSMARRSMARRSMDCPVPSSSTASCRARRSPWWHAAERISSPAYSGP